MRVTEATYIACDFSGIQRYVLGVKAAGKAQAKRLRARSFLLELFEHAALTTFKNDLGVADDDILVSGGGGCMVRVPAETDLAKVEKISADLERKVWSETGGEIQFSLGSGNTPMAARTCLEYRKRRPAISVFQDGERWNTGTMSLPSLGKPCDVCGRSPGVERIENEDENALYCEGCIKARKLGERVVEWDWMRPVEGDEPIHGDDMVSVLGIKFKPTSGPTTNKAADTFKVSRWIPREGRAPMTFEEISEQAQGDRRLAVLKADVDDMGVRIGEIAASDRSYRALREFSRSLQLFFVDDVQRMLSEIWHSLYTIYAGGDDLLLVGPWNVVMDFAGEIHDKFQSGPGSRYNLTMSAGIALTPYRVPIRHAVERAEDLLKLAKEQDGKSSCATLGAVLKWEQHDRLIGDGRKLAGWVKEGGMPRSLVHRLLNLAESDDPVRMARWAYQVRRNITNNEARNWAEAKGRHLQNAEHVEETAAMLRYALLATRTRNG